MINEQQLVVQSLELHLFFGRIMKEHSLFLEAGFTQQNKDFAQTADKYKMFFQDLLRRAVQLSNGVVSNQVLASREIVTEFTLSSEQKTQHFTGIDIDESITRQELRLRGTAHPKVSAQIVHQVRQLNMEAIRLLDGLISFKMQILDNVLSCKMFILNYPLLIEHVVREARSYRNQLHALENGRWTNETLREMELFWDQIMMEHALFIRGLLDPSENELIKTANNFADDYSKLINEAQRANDRNIAIITEKTLNETIKLRDFKTAGTQGIVDCKIRSIILPLLADHVLRESNHFIRLLHQSKRH